MSDVFVVFGSHSDSAVYEPLIKKLEKAGISTELKVLSAHKTPRELRGALNDTNAGIFIAGAGLSAALPGVIASEQVKPVIGIPCDGAFSGLDAFLSCAQMPPEVPVITVGVGNSDSVVRLCGNYLHGLSRIVLVQKKTGLEKKYFDKCAEFMRENSIPFTVSRFSGKTDFGAVYINFENFGKKAQKRQETIITVLVKDSSRASDAPKFFGSLQNSYSVGLNNYKNAALAALELVNLRGYHTQKLLELRKKAAQKVLSKMK